MENEEAAQELEEQGFEFDRVSDEEDNEQYFWWHRKGFCVKFRSADGVVADATEVHSKECRSRG